MKVVKVVKARFGINAHFHAIALLMQSSMLSSNLLFQVLVASQKYLVFNFSFVGLMLSILRDLWKTLKVSQLFL